MNAERLLQHFDRVAEAPGAVPRLRRFILELAVRGSLVGHYPEDESGVDLLDRIKEEKRRVQDAGQIRSEHPLPATTAEDVNFNVPDEWGVARLGEVAVCLDYRRVPINNTERSKRIEGKNQTELFPYYGATQQQGWIDDYLFDEELVLLGEDGVPFFDPLRPKAYVVFGKSWVNNHAHVFRGILMSNRFLVHWLNVFDYSGRVAGATRSKLNQSRAVDIPIALPPLAEQHRIVAKVDELMALCDELEAAQAKREKRRDRLVAATLHGLNNGDVFEGSADFTFQHLPRLTNRPEDIRQLRQTILNLAVRGKLVKQDPKDEPASTLRRNLRTAKQQLQADGDIRNRKPVAPAKRMELGYKIPDSWELPTFDELFDIVSGVTKGRNLAGRRTRELPYLRVANVQRGYLDLSVIKTIRIPEEEVVRYQLRRGDILMTEGGDWDKLGRAAIWNDEVPECIHQNHIFRVRPPLIDELSVGWVTSYVNSFLGRAYFENASKQTTNLASINMTQLRGCPLPLPPLAEQHRIVAKVDELMALCDALEAQLTTTANTSCQLLEAVLHEALAPTA